MFDWRGMQQWTVEPLAFAELYETAEEAAQHCASGRSWPALKESKTFDAERLAESPLFARRLLF